MAGRREELVYTVITAWFGSMPNLYLSLLGIKLDLTGSYEEVSL
jgi:hypothetical protein